MKVGLYLPGASGPPSGVWTRLRDLAAELARDPSVELFGAAQALEPPAELGIAEKNVLLLPQGGRAKLAANASRYVRRFVDTFSLDVVQVEAPPAPRNIGCPVVFSLHDLRQLDRPLPQVRTLGELYMRFKLAPDLRRADAVLALSAWAAHDISSRLRIPRERVHVIPPIAPDALRARSERVPSVQEPFVVAVGHLERRKNLEVLVKATYEPDWPRDTALVLAGRDQGTEQTLRAAAAESPASIHFLGVVSDEQKWWLLHNALAVAVPSRLEGFGIVALEGIAAGTPVLVADSAALPEVARVRQSILPTETPSAWSARINQMSTDASARQRITQAQMTILGQHSASYVAALLVNLYRRLLSASPPFVR
jgi:glycosyltransferase involved in cell wall biosynthesis